MTWQQVWNWWLHSSGRQQFWRLTIKNALYITSMSKVGKSPSFSAILIFYHSDDSVRKRCSLRGNMEDYRIPVEQLSKIVCGANVIPFSPKSTGWTVYVLYCPTSRGLSAWVFTDPKLYNWNSKGSQDTGGRMRLNIQSDGLLPIKTSAPKASHTCQCQPKMSPACSWEEGEETSKVPPCWGSEMIYLEFPSLLEVLRKMEVQNADPPEASTWQNPETTAVLTWGIVEVSSRRRWLFGWPHFWGSGVTSPLPWK